MFKHLLGCFNRSLFEVVLFKLCCINSFWLVIESREAPREPLLIPLPSASTTPPSSKLHHTQQVGLNKHVSQIFSVIHVFFSNCLFMSRPSSRYVGCSFTSMKIRFLKLEKNIARIANAVQVTLWLSITNPQCHDSSFLREAVKNVLADFVR